MDNNQYNHNQNQGSTAGSDNPGGNGDGFYSYGSQSAGSSDYGNQFSGGSYGNQTGQTQPYTAQPYQNQTWQNQTYANQTYQNTAYQQPVKEKKKREKKPGGFGVKLAKCAALALVFGLVSGIVFEGVHLASGAIFGESSAQGADSVLTKSDSDGGIKATATSNTYAAADVSDIVDAVMPSIVAITNVSETEYQSFWGSQIYENTSCGSGIIVSQDASNLYIATNNHVVSGANSLTVTFADNTTASAAVKGTDPSTDLAVVSVSLDGISEETKGNIKVATLGTSDNLKVGQASIAIGNALGYGQSVTTGCISALNREVSVSDSSSRTAYTAELIQTDAAINPGNSGGALLNALGEVIGINSVKYSDTDVEGIGYAIPIDTAMPIIEDLITKEKVDESQSAYLGVSGVDVSDDVSQTYNMPMGVYVAQVVGGSAAEQAGIRKGDIITKFDGREVSGMQELSDRLQYYAAGTTVDVVIMRASDGEYVETTISVTLGRKN